MDPNPVISTPLFVKKNPNVRLIHAQEALIGLGFITKFGLEMIDKFTVKQFFVDSTYKTNSDKMEVFIVLRTVLGTGFPLAYYFLSGAKELQDKQRKDSILDFFRALKRSVPQVQPLFFFSDKDSGQIDAIENVYGIKVSLCLWHMKRSIKKKYGSLREDCMPLLSDDHEKALLQIIDRQYHTHPVLSDLNWTQQELREFSLGELRQFVSHEKYSLLLNYLLENWYSDYWYWRWGRRHSTLIYFSKTTMFAGGHWSMLKRGVLQNCKCPRVYLVVYLISNVVLEKIKKDFINLLSGNEKPHWASAYRAAWKSRNLRRYRHSTEQTKLSGDAVVLHSHGRLISFSIT